MPPITSSRPGARVTIMGSTEERKPALRGSFVSSNALTKCWVSLESARFILKLLISVGASLRRSGMFIVSALSSLLTPSGVRCSPTLWPEDLDCFSGISKLKTTIPHGTPKGVRTFRTLENYKHATPDGVKRY